MCGLVTGQCVALPQCMWGHSLPPAPLCAESPHTATSFAANLLERERALNPLSEPSLSSPLVIHLSACACRPLFCTSWSSLHFLLEPVLCSAQSFPHPSSAPLLFATGDVHSLPQGRHCACAGDRHEAGRCMCVVLGNAMEQICVCGSMSMCCAERY